MRALAIVTAAMLMSTRALACDALVVTGAWIREAPPGAAVMAGYATLRNTGKGPLTIDGVRSSNFGEVAVHEMTMENGQMRMRNTPRLVLDEGATLALEPGDLHLMLFQPRQPLKAGDHVTLKFDCGARSRAVDFKVRAENP